MLIAKPKVLTGLRSFLINMMIASGIAKNILPWLIPKYFAVLESGYHLEIMDCVETFIEGIKVGARPLKDLFDHSMSVG